MVAGSAAIAGRRDAVARFGGARIAVVRSIVTSVVLGRAAVVRGGTAIVVSGRAAIRFGSATVPVVRTAARVIVRGARGRAALRCRPAGIEADAQMTAIDRNIQQSNLRIVYEMSHT